MKRITIGDIEKIYKNRTPGHVDQHSFFAVLVPLVEKDGQLHLLYEVRAEHIRQAGEVCFPGGKVEDGETPKACALRETTEELGVDGKDIRVIRQMDTAYTYSSFTMFPFLGTIPYEKLDPSRYNRQEVKEAFLAPLPYLLSHDPLIYHFTVAPLVDRDFPYEKIKMPDGYNWRKGRAVVPIYEFEEHVIWGLTGRITHNLIKVLKSGGVNHEV